MLKSMEGTPNTQIQVTPIKEAGSDVSFLVSDATCTQLKKHPHGLSAKKKLGEYVSEPNSPDLMFSQQHYSDTSLDCVRRSQDLQPQTQEDGVPKHALEQMDINKMFSNDENGFVDCSRLREAEEPSFHINHSPIRLELDSPVKEDDKDGVNSEGPQPKRLKLELESVPSLPQPNQTNAVSDEPNASPEVIEMIETKSSPMKEFNEEAQYSILETEEAKKEVGSKASPNDKSETPRRQTSPLNTLTPIHQTTTLDEPRKLSSLIKQQESANFNGTFQMINRRNEELVDQVHVLNKKLNKMMSRCEMTSFQYENKKADFEILSQECEMKLNERYEELQTAIKERDKFKDRVINLRKRTDESRDEIKMLNQNQSILQKKYEMISQESDTYRKKVDEVETRYLQIKEQYLKEIEEHQIIKNRFEDASIRLENESKNGKALQQENKHLSAEITRLKEQLNLKDDLIARLQSQLEETANAKQGANDQISMQLNDITLQKSEAEAQLTALRTESETEKNRFISRLNEVEEHLKITQTDSIKLKEDSERLREELAEKSSQIEQLKKSLEEANDDAEIQKAEVKEISNDLMELEGVKSHLESSVIELEEMVKEWQAKYHDQVEKVKVSNELESIQLKNSNIEEEHLAELEQLHINMSSLQDALKKNSETLNELQSENQTLKEEKKNLEEQLNSIDKENSSIEELKKEISAWKERYQLKENESNRSLKLLAEDLYIQYSSKHEQKVKLLKKGYEVKFQGKLDKISLQNEGLTQENEQLKNQLASERKAKQKLLELLETKKNDSQVL